jgi:putative ABC transport system ATP-binding protein
VGDIIKIEKVSKVYVVGQERVVALRNVSLNVANGEFCCVLGTSGSGKSTLLNMIAGLEKPTKGNIVIAGQSINKMNENKLARFRQEHIGFIFQSYNLMPSLTAKDNVAMPLVFRGMSRKERERKALRMLKSVGLGSHVRHRPTQMSGGQQQRVGIARAFVGNPEIVFADEPTGNLDTRTREDVMRLMIGISKANNHTLIMVTHDNELSQYADRVVKIRDGEIADIIVNERPYRPANMAGGMPPAAPGGAT